MVRLFGPFHSDDARATFNKNMTFSNWKGRPYGRIWFKPFNPNTINQINIRFLFAQSVLDWHQQDAGTQETWDDRAKALYLRISGFNFFVQQYILQVDHPVMP